MSRRISILSVTQSGGNPGSFIIGPAPGNTSGDWTSVFQGRFYRDSVGNTQPFYSSATTPAGYTLIEATTFTVTDNPSYAGRYTVWTQPSALGQTSSSFSSGQTTVRVVETVGNPSSPADATSGTITNISTYYIAVAGEGAMVVPPGVEMAGRPVDIVGRGFSGWGEIFLQNQVLAVQNFAGPTAPVNPFIGQGWYDTTAGVLKIWGGSSYTAINAGVTSFRHTQTTAQTTWTVTHNLGAPAPYVVLSQFFIDTGGGVYKAILPFDITFVDANTLTVSFTGSYTGYALVRL
jgi:hypothetical protein